jgi:UDP:flavonoid glycosyltransferase YjiC (YdhE family)
MSSAGVPQVILGVWADTYDYANRAELLGVGRWGNIKACPRWSVSELTPILHDVILENHEHYAARSRMLAQKSKKRGTGRDIAAETILDLVRAQQGAC